MEYCLTSFVSLIILGLIKIVLITFGLPLFICICLYFASGKRLTSNILETFIGIAWRVVRSAMKTIDSLCEFAAREASGAIPTKHAGWRGPVKLVVRWSSYILVMVCALGLVAHVGTHPIDADSAPTVSARSDSRSSSNLPLVDIYAQK